MTKSSQQFAHLFLNPDLHKLRLYEALRAYFVEGKPWAAIAKQFGLNEGTLRNLASELRKSGAIPLFDRPAEVQRSKRDQRILELRLKEHLSNAEIHQRLSEEGIKAGTTTIGLVLKQAGIPKLPRRSIRTSPKVTIAAQADVRRFHATSSTFSTQFAGLFLFARELADANIGQLLTTWPTSKRIPALTMIRSLLALKLWGIGRPYHVMPSVLDEGIALFAGLNVIPKKSTLSEYSSRVDLDHLDRLMAGWHRIAQQWVPTSEKSFDLDFHTIPYHGDELLMQKHFVSSRSRRQRGILALVVREASQCVLIYGDAKITKETQNDAIFSFIESWKQRTGELPKDLVFDSRFTTYANLARLNALGIYFLTLRKRAPSIVDEINQSPSDQWKKIQLHNIGRRYSKPYVLDQIITLTNYPDPLRQLAIKGLGHELPTLLITNYMKQGAAELIDRYARRMLVENAIQDAINFFHMDALSSTIPMRIDLDLQLTIIASTLYQAFAKRLDPLYRVAKNKTLFEKLVKVSGKVITDKDRVIVKFNRHAHNSELRSAGYIGSQGKIPWLHDRTLFLEYQ